MDTDAATMPKQLADALTRFSTSVEKRRNAERMAELLRLLHERPDLVDGCLSFLQAKIQQGDKNEVLIPKCVVKVSLLSKGLLSQCVASMMGWPPGAAKFLCKSAHLCRLFHLCTGLTGASPIKVHNVEAWLKSMQARSEALQSPGLLAMVQQPTEQDPHIEIAWARQGFFKLSAAEGAGGGLPSAGETMACSLRTLWGEKVEVPEEYHITDKWALLDSDEAQKTRLASPCGAIQLQPWKFLTENQAQQIKDYMELANRAEEAVVLDFQGREKAEQAQKKNAAAPGAKKKAGKKPTAPAAASPERASSSSKRPNSIPQGSSGRKSARVELPPE